jgi:hypothetical protein
MILSIVRFFQKPTAAEIAKKELAEFETMQLRTEVIDMVREVEDIFEAKYNVRPTHSSAFMNALQLYKTQLQAA